MPINVIYGPFVWDSLGQRLDDRDAACGVQTWDPHELQGQCFGLGSRKTLAEESAENCRTACCGDPTCGTWQWRSDVGCVSIPCLLAGVGPLVPGTSLLVSHRGHIEQAYGLPPVWLRSCEATALLRLNRLRRSPPLPDSAL